MDVCPDCEGEGEIQKILGDNVLDRKRCDRCEGTGKVEEEEEDESES